MKYLFALLLLLTLCGAADAQIVREVKAGTTDTTRLKVTYTIPDGTFQTNETAWDTVTVTRQLTKDLYRDGNGFIGSYFISSTEDLRDKIREVIQYHTGENNDQLELRAAVLTGGEEMGHAEGESDTDYVGIYTVSGNLCPITSDSVTIYEDAGGLRVLGLPFGSSAVKVVHQEMIFFDQTSILPMPWMREPDDNDDGILDVAFSTIYCTITLTNGSGE